MFLYFGCTGILTASYRTFSMVVDQIVTTITTVDLATDTVGVAGATNTGTGNAPRPPSFVLFVSFFVLCVPCECVYVRAILNVV